MLGISGYFVRVVGGIGYVTYLAPSLGDFRVVSRFSV